jgi:hypothetical protein
MARLSTGARLGRRLALVPWGTDEEAEPAGPASSEDDLACLRCGGRMAFLGDRDLHEGTRAWGFVLGDLGELSTSRTRLEMYACESCGHIELFVPDR